MNKVHEDLVVQYIISKNRFLNETPDNELFKCVVQLQNFGSGLHIKIRDIIDEYWIEMDKTPSVAYCLNRLKA